MDFPKSRVYCTLIFKYFLYLLGLEVTKQDLESEKRKNIGLLEQLKDRDRKLKEVSNDLENSKIFR